METPRYIEQPLHEYLRQHAREQPGKPAYLWYGRAITYAELDRASDAFAARLAELGVRKGEPVALFMNNCPQYVMAHYGIQKLGAIVCPCGPLFKEHELQYQLDDLKARVVVAADTLVPIVDQVRARTAITHVFATGYAELLPTETPSIDIPAELLALQREPRQVPAGCEDFLTVTRSGAISPEASIAMDDVALMTYTSGTTGLPKGAMLSYRNAVYKTAAAADCNGLRGSDMLLAIAPLYHIAGMVMGVNVAVYTGATCVLTYRFDPVATLQAIARHRISSWYSIAPMNVACMQVPGARDYDLSSLLMNSVTSFGITFTETLATQWREHAPNCRSFESGYGLSETHTVDTYMPKDAIHWGTHGVPVPGNEIRILDPETLAPMPVGEPGEIVLRSAGAFKGYWNNPEATAKTLRGGWVHTGDMGRIDAEGYLTFTGRFKEMIKVSGYAVFPEQVETILIKHPAVAQAAVIGVPDSTKGEIIRAFIVRKAGQDVTAESLIAWARDNMSAYKAPREVRFIDALPATGAGKVLRRLLKDLP
ncbi:AMP-dependent synthetase [Ramlibacter sp. WS9]|nr:AMP-dependent synthetase [Ramlibacter sp. WS9]